MDLAKHGNMDFLKGKCPGDEPTWHEPAWHKPAMNRMDINRADMNQMNLNHMGMNYNEHESHATPIN